MLRSNQKTGVRFRSFASKAMTLAMAAGAICSAPAQAESASASSIVKAMSDYLASQTSLTSEFDIELDIITPELEKIQFDASGTMQLARPDKLRLVRIGGYTELELAADGKTVTISDRGSKTYAQFGSLGSVDNLIEMLRRNYGIDMPGADLLLTNSYSELMDGVIEAKHIGVGIIDGVECEHLAFRNADTDWQLWVRTGARPLPCKYVISSKTVAGAPEYVVRFRSWKTGEAMSPNAFAFAPAKDSKLVAIDQLSGIGELPPPAPFKTGER